MRERIVPFQAKVKVLLENLQVLLESDNYSFNIFSFGEFLGSKHFFKNCGPYCIQELN